MMDAYLETSSWSPALTASLQLREVFSTLSMYISDMGIKLPFLLQSKPWAALSAAPSEAESVTKLKNFFI